jgi:FkbM family methyltransferase
MKKLIQKILELFGIKILRTADFEKLWVDLTTYRNLKYSIELLSEVPLSLRQIFQDIFIENYKHSRSQILQDIFVLAVLGPKKNGYFVEAGASDGLDCSNTFLLEKNFDWNGLLIEPSKLSFKKIAFNRKASAINSALFSASGLNMQFRETVSPGLSSLSDFSNNDYMSSQRVDKLVYQVETITLQDALNNAGAPKVVDFLSLDTEGSEFEILKNFDFNTYSFSVITVEHAFSEQRERVYELLTSNGYQRVLSDISAYDDWYINENLLTPLRDKITL